MAYQKTTWVNGVTKVNADNMNKIEDGIYNVFPKGMMVNYGGSIAPDGWLICDGSAISRTTYSDLFDVIGTTYGTGDGSTTFNLPNLKGKVVVGLDSNDTDFDTLGNTGGNKTHTLVASEIPISSFTAAGMAGDWSYKGGGTAQPHNNLQPYIVMNYIIKY